MNRSASRGVAIPLLLLALGFSGRSSQAAGPPTFSVKWDLPAPPTSGTLEGHDLAVDALGHVLVIHRDGVETYDSAGNFLGRFGSSGSAPGQFNGPLGLAVDAAGNVYVADTGNHRVQKLTSSGTPLLSIGSQGSGDGQFSSPQDVAVKSDGSIYVADWGGNRRIEKFDAAGNYLTQWAAWPFGLPLQPCQIVADPQDDVFVLGSVLGHILELDANDAAVLYSMLPYSAFALGMAVGPDGQMVITDAGYNVLYLFDRGGTMRAVIDLNSPGNMRVGSADGVAVDALGNIYFSDRLYHTVQKFVPAPPTPANPTSWGRVKGLYR